MLAKLRPDRFTLLLLCCVILASLLPVEGRAAEIFSIATDIAVALLFFLHGARLSRDTVIAGATHWRLHLTILACTYVLFPILGLGISTVAAPLVSPALATGLLYLCVLPSTVQSSIAFTAMAGGNVPAAVCAATASNIVGMVATPLLVGLLFGAKGVGLSWNVLGTIVILLLLPFIAGQILQPFVGDFVRRHRPVLVLVDRGAILMVVYLAFSESVTSGLWTQFSVAQLLGVVAIAILLLALVLVVTTLVSRRLGFSRADEIAIVFCGSKKSLASGVPMANVIFAGQAIGAIVLPVMIFHQIQLMVCAWLARHYAEKEKANGEIARSERS